MTEPLRYLSLFSGIGGFELAAEIANQAIGFDAFEPAALCEINPFAQKVLQHHYPSIPLIPDVRTISVEFIRELGRIDGIVGGFPCQDVFNAGKRAGLEGERSGLFYEIIRLVRLVRPRFVYLENVAALIGRGLSDVLGEFAAIGYDAEWSVIPCSTLGGSHKRERIWIIAYPQGDRLQRNYKQGCSPGGFREGFLPKSARTNTDASPHPSSARLNDRQCTKGRGQTSFTSESQRSRSKFDWQEAVESLARGCHDGIPIGSGDDSAYLLRLADLPDWLEYAAVLFPIAHRKEALQAYGNAIVPQVGAIGFLKIYSLLQAENPMENRHGM